MISGFGSSSSSYTSYESHHLGDGALPIPFNIPIVLHNILFEEIGIVFDSKQKDMLDTLRFSNLSLTKIDKKYRVKSQELNNKLFYEPNNTELKTEKEELDLDILDAHQHFKELVTVLSEMLTREQYAKLLKYSNIPV